MRTKSCKEPKSVSSSSVVVNVSRGVNIRIRTIHFSDKQSVKTRLLLVVLPFLATWGLQKHNIDISPLKIDVANI